jgi:hypothetical protein
MLGGLHLAASLFIFFHVQNSTDGQAGFIWFSLMTLDYPTAGIAYRFLGNIRPMIALVDWWYGIGQGQGPNIRALILIGLFGTLHWLLVGAAFTWVIENLCRRKPNRFDLTGRKG